MQLRYLIRINPKTNGDIENNLLTIGAEDAEGIIALNHAFGTLRRHGVGLGAHIVKNRVFDNGYQYV